MHMVSTHLLEIHTNRFLMVKVTNGDEQRMAFQHQAWMTVAVGWQTSIPSS